MNPTGLAILEHLRAVDGERIARSRDPLFAERVTAVKTYQQVRFANTYADLFDDSRHAAAARFFLDELYGPHDFAQRDTQFAARSACSESARQRCGFAAYFCLLL